MRATSHIAIGDASGNLDVIYYAAERRSYGTREDKKVAGDASFEGGATFISCGGQTTVS